MGQIAVLLILDVFTGGWSIPIQCTKYYQKKSFFADTSRSQQADVEISLGKALLKRSRDSVQDAQFVGHGISADLSRFTYPLWELLHRLGQ